MYIYIDTFFHITVLDRGLGSLCPLYYTYKVKMEAIDISLYWYPSILHTEYLLENRLVLLLLYKYPFLIYNLLQYDLLNTLFIHQPV